jgi:hypothetical protein
MTDIVIVNSSSALTDHAVRMVIPELQAVINEEWRPDGGATLHFVGRTDDIPREMLPLFLLNHADNHRDMTLPDDVVFVADVICNGASWVDAVKHSVGTMLIPAEFGGEPTPERRVPRARPTTSIEPPDGESLPTE